MAIVEAQLVYKPGYTSEGTVPIAKTASLAAIRLIKDEVLREAREELRVWENVDPGLAAMHEAEVNRLRTILDFLVSEVSHRSGKPQLVIQDSEDPGNQG